MCFTGADPGIQVRGAHLQKLRRAEGGAKMLEVFRVKNHDFTPKNHIFSNFRGGGGCPPGSSSEEITLYIIIDMLVMCIYFASVSTIFHLYVTLERCSMFYPAMTAFTDQYSLPNIFFDIGQL